MPLVGVFTNKDLTNNIVPIGDNTNLVASNNIVQVGDNTNLGRGVLQVGDNTNLVSVHIFQQHDQEQKHKTEEDRQEKAQKMANCFFKSNPAGF